MRAVLLTLLVAFASSGCRPTPDDWPDVAPYCSSAGPTRPLRGSVGPPLGDLCGMIAASLCAQWQRCGCDDGTGSVVLDACTARVESECDAFANGPDVADALERRTVEWSGAETSAFLASLTEATSGCDPVNLDLSGVIQGTLPDMMPCTDISGAFTECLDGSSCVLFAFGWPVGTAPGHFCVLGFSLATQGVGERCNGYANGGCRPGLRCAPTCDGAQFDGTCTDLLAFGAECRWDSECLTRFCALEPGSSSYHYAHRGRCAAPRALADGASCTSDEACLSGFCDRWALLGEGPTIRAGVCAARRPVADGEDCSSSAECASGACSGFRLATLNRCAWSGAACTGGADCASAGGCVTGIERGMCGSPAADGARCADGAACASGTCDFSSGSFAEARCITRAPPPPPLAAGAPCTSRDACADGVCLTGVCTRVERALGEPCESADLCASRSCVAGTCAPAVCSARIDPTGHGSFWQRLPVLTPG